MDRTRKVVRGRAFVVANNNRQFGEDPEYLNIWAQLPGSVQDVPLLFTPEQIEDAKKRAAENEEDIYAMSSVWPVGYVEPIPELPGE